MKFNKRKASRAVAYLLSAVMVSQALLSPVSMVYANGDDDSSQQQTAQVENANGGGYASSEDAAAKQGASDDTAAVTEASSAGASAKQGSDDAAASTQAAGSATTTATQAAGSAAAQGSAATQGAVATQADDGYNANADPIIIDKNTDPNDVTVEVGLFTDADRKNELGDTAVGASDSIYANVSMTFNKNIKPTKSSPNVEYVFPDLIKVANNSGVGVEDGKTMYTWSIQDNVFKIQFTEAFFEAHNSEIYTKADFDFKLDTSKVGEDGKLDVTFPGTGTTVTINQKEGNVSGGKTCELGSDGKTISYTVTLNPETNVTDFKLVDQLGGSLSYNNDFKLDGQDVKASVDGKTATINLDKLSQGNHTLTYTATIDQDALDNLKPGANGNNGLNSDAFKNKAKWMWSGKPEGNTSEAKPDASFDLVKSKSSTDKGDGTCEWVVDLNAGTLKADMKGYTFTDKLENSDALEYEGSYRVIDVTDGNKEVASGKLDSSKGSFDYTFGSDAQKHQYKIVYNTKVKAGASYGEYKNTAIVDDHDGDKDSVTSSVDYKPKGTADVKKEITQEVDADGYVSWKVTIGLSKMSAGSDITKAWFTDVPGYGYNESTNTKDDIWFENDADLELTANGKKLEEGKDYNVYWRNSSSPWDDKATSPEEKNWEFKLVFTEKAQSFVGKTDVIVTYRTKCSKKTDLPYRNTAKFNDGYKSPEQSDQKSYIIETKDSTTKSGWMTWDQDFDWSKVDASDTTKGAWVANWKVDVNLPNNSNGEFGLNDTDGKPIFIEDELPTGMTYVRGSGRYIIQANFKNPGPNGVKCYAEGALDDVATIADGRLAASIPTADVYDGKGAHRVWAELTYQTAIKATTEQKDLSFTNKVSSGVGNDSYGSAEATATGKQSLVNKTAQYDKKNNLVNYTVNVNDQAQDLIHGSDVVTLTDTLTGKADLVTDSIKVTDASGASLDHSKWAYSIEQGSDASGNPTTTLKLILPDSCKLKVSYTASLNGQIGDTGTLKNNAKLGGTKSWSSAQEQNYTVAKSDVSGGGISSSISIVKKDGSSPDKSLAGAQYSLYKIANISDLASGSKEDIENAGKFVTAKKSDEQGKIVFGGEGEQKLETATLYYFKETASPTGYIKNDTITCVVLKGNDEAKYAEVVNQLKAKGVKFETVSSFTRYNTPTSEAKAEFKARKILNGKALAKDEFTFIATDEKGNEVARGTNDAEGNVTLTGDKLSWDKEGSYTYTISEVNDGKSGVTYSKDSYKAVVTVWRDGAYGPLRSTVTYQNADGTPLDANALPTFTNTYKETEVAPVSVTFSARKTVDGKRPTAGQVFQFELKDGDKVLQTKPNDENGNIVFDTIPYEGEGEHDYTISEQPKAGFKCDTKTVKVHVVVTKKDGKLSASVTYDGSSDVPTFDNKELVSIPVQKEWSGRTAEKAEFQLVADGKDVEGKTLTLTDGDNWRGSFNGLRKVADDGHEIKYTVKEISVPDGYTSESTQKKDGTWVFTNTYQETKGIGVELFAKKTVDGAAPSDAQKFSFDLNKSDESGAKGDWVETVKNEGEKVFFSKLTYTDAADEWYTISEQQPEAKDGFEYDSKTAKVHVVVTKGNDNQLTAAVTYFSGDKELSGPATFKNEVAPISTKLSVKKLVNGGSEIAANKEFSFSLYETGDKDEPKGDAIDTVAVKPGETAAFGKGLSFKKAGTYQYVIEETGDLGDGWTKANPVTATVDVVANENGTLSVKSVTYSKSDKDSEGSAAALFDNTYEASGSATLAVQKTVNGKAPVADAKFDFELTPLDGAPMPDGAKSLVATTKGSKAVSFPALAYTLKDAGKTYRYLIHETSEATEGWTNAGDVIAKVTVGPDQGNGKLGAPTVEYVSAADEKASAANADGTAVLFDNTYKRAAAEGSFQLSLVKKVNKEAPLTGEKFEFSAAAEGANADTAPALANVTTDTDGAAAFKTAKLSDKDAGKTYTYRIHEVTDPKGGKGVWTKAVDVIATVAVGERSNDGKLAAKVTYCKVARGEKPYEGTAQFNNVFAPVAASASVKVKKASVNDSTDVKADETYTFGLYKKGQDGQSEGEAIATVSGKLGKELAFASDKLTFDKAGTHEYLVREETHNGSEGWDAVADVPVTVTVKAKGGNGPDARDLTATVKYGDSGKAKCASFADTYTASGSATLKVSKIVNGGKDKAEGKTFQFVLKDAEGKELSRTTAAAGETAKFSPIEYSFADAGKTYKYTVSEVGCDSGRWFKAGDVTAEAKVSDNGDGTLKIEVAYSNPNEEKTAALFDNTHAAPAKAELKVSKTINGSKEDGAKEKFAFELAAKDDAPMPASSELTVDGTGTDSFGEISYSEPGTYEYTIRETSDLGAGWKNAKDVTATVTVKRDEDAKTLKVTGVAYSNATDDGSAAAFDNAYTAKGTEVSLKAAKALKGAELKAGQFEFQLKDAEGRVLQTAKNDEDGKVSFDPISYEPSDLDGRGTSRDFEYTISEVVPDGAVDGAKDGVTYDTTEHKVKVHVSDDGASGQLEATVTYDGKSEPPVFTNTYKPKEEKPHGDTPKDDTPKGDTPKGGKSSGKTVFDVFGMPATGDNTTLFVTVVATAGLCALASGLRLARRKRG